MADTQDASVIVKTVTIQIGGERTTDQMVAAAKKDCGDHNVNDFDINQRKMPSGYGKLRVVIIEFREFLYPDPYTEQVCDWINQPGYGHSTYEDGLRYREAEPEALKRRSHIFIPEAPWCDTDGFPYALCLWSLGHGRKVDVSRCHLRSCWLRECIFARRKYSVG
jgi:hypothetical protein